MKGCFSEVGRVKDCFNEVGRVRQRLSNKAMVGRVRQRLRNKARILSKAMKNRKPSKGELSRTL